MLVSSHVLAEVAQTVDEVVVIHKGRLRAHSTLAELTGARGGRESGCAARRPSGSAEPLGPQAAEVTTADGALLVNGAADRDDRGAGGRAPALVLHELAPAGDASLEDVFLELTKEGGVPPSRGRARDLADRRRVPEAAQRPAPSGG